MKLASGIDCKENPFFVGCVTKKGIVAYSKELPLKIQIIRGSYFDSEISPTLDDVRLVTIGKTPLFILSPEFIVVSKLSYPNVHRLFDFHDVLALNQFNCLQDTEYLSRLLDRTSLHNYIDVEDILRLKTLKELQAFLESIRHQLIRRFLYWDFINVEILNLCQCFVLLDANTQIMSLPFSAVQFVNKILCGCMLKRIELQIARLGLHLLIAKIPERCFDVLYQPDFQKLIYRGIEAISHYPNFWLSNCKVVSTTLQQLALMESSTTQRFDSFWNIDTLIKIVQRIFFDDFSNYSLITSIKSIYHDLKTEQISISDCMNLLHKLLEPIA